MNVAASPSPGSAPPSRRGAVHMVTEGLSHAQRWAIAGYGASIALVVVMGAAIWLAAAEERRSKAGVSGMGELSIGISRLDDAIDRAERWYWRHLLRGEPESAVRRDEALAAARSEAAALQGLARDQAPVTARQVPTLVDELGTALRSGEPGDLDATQRRIAQLVQSITHETHATQGEAIASISARRDRVIDSFQAFLAACALVTLLAILPAYVVFVRAWQAHRRLADRVVGLVADLPGAIYQLRTWPDGRMRFELLSASVAKVRGVDPEAALRDPGLLVDAAGTGEREPFHGKPAEAASQADFPVIRPDTGERRWIRSIAAGKAVDDGSVLWTGHWEDITAEKEMEEGLRRAVAAADEANHAKSRFLATMSHEIRTPMNGVLAMLELMSQSGLDPAQASALEIARESGTSLLRIIDDILDFSRIEAGRVQLLNRATSIPDLVRRVWNMHSGGAAKKGVAFTVAVDEKMPAVLVDPVRLQQILNNLASNAIKFTERGTVSIACEAEVRLRGILELSIRVADSGIGMTPEELERIREPFMQASAETAVRYGGSGLGLSICRRLAALMGGSLELASSPGNGTQAHLRLRVPIANAPPASQRVAAPIPLAGTGAPSILLVDDHPVNREVLLRQIARLGYRGEPAADGVEALEKWRSGRFPVVLTDCGMPRMDGYALTRAIREEEARRGSRRTAVVACTANAYSGDRQRCMDAGMNAMLVKPIELASLGRLLSMCTAPAFDLEVLEGIVASDSDARRQLAARFREASRVDRAGLRAAVDSRDLALIKSWCHRVAGSVDTLGAQAAARAARAIEQRADRGDWAGASEACAAFDAEVARLDLQLGALEDAWKVP